MKAIIIGAGIGGLSAALALRKAGIEVVVYERAPVIREVGAGISLWANAIRALDHLGLGDQIRSRSAPYTRTAVLRGDGNTIVQSSLDQIEKRYGDAVVVLRRSDLVALLSAGLEEVIRTGRTLTGFVNHEDSVTARFEDGSEASADILVGCDGLNSTVRAQLHPGEKLRYSGYTAWRAITRFETAGMIVSETWGRGKRFGIVPMSGGSLYWFATNNTPAEQKDVPGQTKAHLFDLFGAWHHPIPDVIRATDESAILRNDIFDRDPPRSWGVGRVSLLGDAAHPMTPNLGQGGCQAIEDGLVLARSLSAHTAPGGLRAYEQERMARTTPVVLRSRQIGVIGQWQNPVACLLRDWLFAAMPSGLALRQLDSIAGYQKHLDGSTARPV